MVRQVDSERREDKVESDALGLPTHVVAADTAVARNLATDTPSDCNLAGEVVDRLCEAVDVGFFVKGSIGSPGFSGRFGFAGAKLRRRSLIGRGSNVSFKNSATVNGPPTCGYREKRTRTGFCVGFGGSSVSGGCAGKKDICERRYLEKEDLDLDLGLKKKKEGKKKGTRTEFSNDRKKVRLEICRSSTAYMLSKPF